ncbi:hypothetical protein SAMN05192539_104243 [Paraburkholderia diazotrophica]|uniref:Uncharacterized protein n=1 Tax=Paraburkholderia diazotrophica TaxID=667676 RepID=A0A1H7E4W0_9BURK|nr:hypothetical protein SAMN05192539_104243 [Paraburkholderia diazotrophica]
MQDEDIQVDRYEIAVSGSGDTVWINGNDGLCWARFSKRFGIDVHRSASMQQADTECLYCTHGEAGVDDWAIFRAEVLRHHGVAVDADTLSFA